ncbi:MAG: hypothetical protein AAFY88_02430, partial [Acidobacteriota bacterium]
MAILLTDALPPSPAGEAPEAPAGVSPSTAASSDAAIDVKAVEFGDGVPAPTVPQGIHLFMLSRAAVATETTGGRRRLHHFEPATDVHIDADQRPLADLLLRLGCATRALPPPGKRDTLVRFEQPTDVAGLRLATGAVAALDFDPMAVLPQLRSLDLYPWKVLPIDKLD